MSDTGPIARKRPGFRASPAELESSVVRPAAGHRLHDLLNVADLQALLDRLHDAFDCPTAVIDTEDNVLTAAAWADACTRYGPLAGGDRGPPVTAKGGAWPDRI